MRKKADLLPVEASGCHGTVLFQKAIHHTFCKIRARQRSRDGETRMFSPGRLMKFWTIAALFLTAGMALAEEPFSSIFGRIAKVDQFAFGPTGYAGRISQGEKDFRAILVRSSVVDFEKLFRAGNMQAKCYALVGIRRLSPGRYNDFAKSLRSSKEMVETVHGCIGGKETVAEVIKHIDAGDYG